MLQENRWLKKRVSELESVLSETSIELRLASEAKAFVSAQLDVARQEQDVLHTKCFNLENRMNDKNRELFNIQTRLQQEKRFRILDLEANSRRKVASLNIDTDLSRLLKAAEKELKSNCELTLNYSEMIRSLKAELVDLKADLDIAIERNVNLDIENQVAVDFLLRFDTSRNESMPKEIDDYVVTPFPKQLQQSNRRPNTENSISIDHLWSESQRSKRTETETVVYNNVAEENFQVQQMEPDDMLGSIDTFESKELPKSGFQTLILDEELIKSHVTFFLDMFASKKLTGPTLRHQAGRLFELYSFDETEPVESLKLAILDGKLVVEELGEYQDLLTYLIW